MCSAAKATVIYHAALKVSGLINFLFPQTGAAIQKRTRTKTTVFKLLEGWGRARERTPCATVCWFQFYERTSLQCLWFGAECVSAVGVVYWHTELRYASFFKAREPENIQITQSNSDKLVCLQRAVMLVRRYVNLAGSPLATNSWVKSEDTDWRSEAKICHSDTNHGDLKRSGMLAELRDSERSIVADWLRGTRGVQWQPSISWSRSLGTANYLGTPVFHGSASVSPPSSVTAYMTIKPYML